MSRSDLMDSKFKNVLNGSIGGLEPILIEYTKVLMYQESDYYARMTAQGLMGRGHGRANLTEAIEAQDTSDELVATDISDASYDNLNEYLAMNKDNALRYGCIVGFLIHSGIMPYIRKHIILEDSVAKAVDNYYETTNNKLQELFSEIKTICDRWPQSSDCEFIQQPYSIATASSTSVSDDGVRKVYSQLLRAGVPENELVEVWTSKLKELLKEYKSLYSSVYKLNSRAHKIEVAKKVLDETPYKFSLTTYKATNPSISKNINYILGADAQSYLIKG